MAAPSKVVHNQSGQVLVIFLLVLVIGLALVLSIASRTVTDIRQTTTSDESNRAYFAAESGIEDALKKLEDGSLAAGTDYQLNFSGTDRASSDVNVTALNADPDEILDFLEFEKDQVAQINLMRRFDDLNTRNPLDADGVAISDTINLYWGFRSDGASYTSFSTSPAIEVSIVTYNPASSPQWKIHKMTYSNFVGSDFCTGAGVIGVDPADAGADKYRYRVRLRPDTNAGCARNDLLVAADHPVLARVRFLNRLSPLGVSITGNNLPQQGERVESLGETPSGVTRKLEVSRFYPALPALFDYVLFNGSSQSLCKGTCP